MVTLAPLAATAWVKSIAGRACSPTFDPTVTLRSAMESSFAQATIVALMPEPAPDPPDAVENASERQPAGDPVPGGHITVSDWLKRTPVVVGLEPWAPRVVSSR